MMSCRNQARLEKCQRIILNMPNIEVAMAGSTPDAHADGY